MLLWLAHLAFAEAPAERVEDTWDLSVLYPSVDAWEAEMKATEAAVDGVASCKGQLASRLRECLDLRFGVHKTVMRLNVYASNASNADTRDADWLSRSQRGEMLYARLDEVGAFYKPEIITLGGDAVEKAIGSDKALGPYDYYLRSAIRDGAHILPAREEALLAGGAVSRDATVRVRSQLVNAELPWPEVTLSDGTKAKLSPANYTAHRGSPVRADRQLVFDQFFGALSKYGGTLAAALDGAVQGHWYVAKARGYPTSVAAAIDTDHVPQAVYDTLVARTNANLPTLHRYLKLRAKMLGISDLAYSDLYPPLVSGTRTWTIDEAKQLTIDATRVLGAAYTAESETGLRARWTDVYPREGKVSGAYMDGAAYDVHPFMLLNYTGDYEAVSTLAHEWGHAMHSVLSRKAQPYAKADYATFTAEIASTTNEAFLLDHMLKTTKNEDERLFYLGSALEGLRTTYFRQALFAEFELAMHTAAEQGQPLTREWLDAKFLEITRRYYGHDAGITKVPDSIASEWSYIPHFYYNFYVYQYATSIAAGSLFADDVLAKKKGAVDRYLGLLSAGGSDDPYVLLQRAGVDMATAAPYDAIATRMERIMDEIEGILAKKAKKKK